MAAQTDSPKVLLIRLSALGDLVLSTAAIHRLKGAGYSVALVTKSEFAPLFAGQPEVSEVFAFDKRQGEKLAKEALFSWIEARNFVFAIDLQNSWRTWSWRRQLRARMPIHVLAKPRLREWLILGMRLGRWFGFGPGGRALRFRTAAEEALARFGGAEGKGSESTLTRMSVSESERSAVRSILPAGEFVALLPGGAWKSKEWPYFPELARLLARRVPVVVLGGAKDEICERVAAAALGQNKESRSLHGRTSLRESMAVLAEARWILGNDTGMMHVAEALGKDVVMIEGPTHSEMGFSPYRKHSMAVGLSLICRPCSKSGRVCLRFGSRLCLNGLSVDEVAARLREMGFPC